MNMMWLKHFFREAPLGAISPEIRHHEEKIEEPQLAGCPGKRQRMPRTANLET